MTEGMEPEVLLLDIRDRDLGDEGWAAVGRHADRGRVLIVDRVDRLAGRGPFYERILGTRAVRAVLCLVVGPADDGGGVALRLSPAMAASEVAATLWAGDLTGVEWDMDRGHAYAGRGDPDRNLLQLQQVLLLPEIFDTVVAQTRDIPDRVASVGFTVMSGHFGDELLADALSGGLERLIGGADAARSHPGAAADLAAADRSPGRVLAVLAGASGHEPPDPLVPGEPLAARRDAALWHVRDLGTLRSELEAVTALLRTGPSASAAGKLSTAGTALRAFRDDAGRLFDEADGFDGEDHAVRDRLRRAGVRVDADPRLGDPAEALRDLVRSEFRRTVSLHTLAVRLRAYAAHVAPGGSGAHRPRLARECPDRLLGELSGPSPFLLDPMRAGLLAAAAALGFVAGLALGPLADSLMGALLRLLGVIVVVAGAWGAGVALLHAKVPEAYGEHGWAGLPGRPLAAHGAAAALGVLAGHAVWRVPPGGDWPPPPLPVTVFALLVVAAGMGFTLYGWWRGAVARWCGRLPVHAADDAARRLTAVVTEVAVQEWVLAKARRAAADTAQTYASVLEDLIRALHLGVTEQRTRLAGAAAPVSRRGAVGFPEYGAEFAQVVWDDLADLAAHVLDPLWQQMYGGALRDVTWRIEERARAELDDYWDHLRQRGVHERPPFAGDNPRRTELAECVWRRSPQVAELVRMQVGARMTQLCDQDELRYLRATGGAVSVRFVPRVAQPPVGAGGHRTGQAIRFPGDVVWTAASQFAGVLRLVPLRTGMVDVTWAKNASPPHDWTAGAGGPNGTAGSAVPPAGPGQGGGTGG
ncbi:hypothetical protein ABGB17_29660 [Sphaerisporangium sp. B11E5]|uniref:hypothetical protein n=1 Tax=Sphaerisporangium sp. B11E5 TaxID=3153563 RepID=UPI00325E1D6D